jgi:histidine triad (HIT) family protein
MSMIKNLKNCLFCQIVTGKLPAYQIYEDGQFLAFLDIRPLNPGHTLVIPKNHYRWVIDVPNFADYWMVVGKIAKMMQKKLKPESFNFVVLGYEIPHAHIHLIPRFKADGLGATLDWRQRKELSEETMLEISEKLKMENSRF